MRSATLGALALLVAAGCGAPAARPARRGSLSARPQPATAAGCETGEADGPRACAVARVDAAAGVVEVELRIDPALLAEGRREVRLAFRSSVLGARYAEERVDLLEGAWSLGALARPAVVRYRVTLDADGRASFRRPGGWHLTGQSFLPDVLVDGAPVDAPASLRIDAGETPVWSAAGAGQRLFDAPSLRRLASEAYEIGELAVTTREAGGTALLVGASGPADALAPLADLLAQAVRGLAARLGPPPADGLFVVVHAIDGAPRAERLGASLVVRDLGGARGDVLYGPLALSLGELVRFWSPGTHGSVEPWLTEGVGAYLALATAAELARAPAEEVARAVLARGGDTAGDPARVGLIAGFCLDAHLHGAGSSLGAVLRTTLARDDDEPIGAEALLEDLGAVSPASASYLAALLTEGAPSLDECVERFGFRAREVSFEGWSDAALAAEVLGAPELRALEPVPGLLAVSADAEAGPLEAGDVLLAVEGARVGSLDDVAWALRATGAGERVRLSIRRRGEPLALEVELPQLGADRRESRSYRELLPAED